MELLKESSAKYLIAASLESLHGQSRDWLNEVEFWKDEMAFFYKLIHMREPRVSFPTAGLADLEKELLSITSDKLGTLRTDIENHERYLREVMTSITTSTENEYRKRHITLAIRLSEMRTMITNFKRHVYAFI